jgi:hypothetical protein
MKNRKTLISLKTELGVDYENWFNKSHREMELIVEEIISFMGEKGISYLQGDEEALPCIAACVVHSQLIPVYGSFIRDKKDRATGMIEGNPPTNNQRYVKLIKKK